MIGSKLEVSGVSQTVYGFDPCQDATCGKIDILDSQNREISDSVQYIDVVLREFLDVNTAQALEVCFFIALITLHSLPRHFPSFLIVDGFQGQETMRHQTNHDQIHLWKWHTHHLTNVVSPQLVQGSLGLLEIEIFLRKHLGFTNCFQFFYPK
jgi:hypothetical protein